MMGRLKEQFRKRLPEGSFGRNVITLMSGTTFAQVLTILAAPILTRLYSPGDFGVYAIYTSILGIIATVACWRYELAIILPEKDEDAASLFFLSILICSAMTILTLILVALFRVPFAELINAPALARWLWFLPLSLFVAGLFQTLNYWVTRRKMFKLLALRQITISSVTVATQFTAGGIMHLGSLGLIAGSILGQVIATIRLAWLSLSNDLKYLTNCMHPKKIQAAAAEYKRFPLYLSIAAFLNVLSAELPLILFGYYFGPTIVGFFILGKRVVGMPLSVVEGAIAQVFFPKASDAYRDGNLDTVVLKTFSQLFSFILVPIILLIIAGPDLISIVFGDEWRMAGVFLVWLAPRILAQFISSPLSLVFVVHQRQDLNLKIDTLLFLSNIGMVVIGGLLNNPLLAIQLLGIVTFVCYSIACYVIFKVAGLTFTDVFKRLAYSFAQAIPYVIIPLLALLFVHHAGIIVITSVLCGCLFLIFKTRELGSIYLK